MSYCRFENTASDVQDIIENWDEGVSSKDEARARKELVDLAEQIIALYEQDRGLVNNFELNEEGQSYEADDDDSEDGDEDKNSASE